MVIVDVLVRLEGKNVLYKGFGFEFFMKKDGGLDSIVIKYPYKKNFSTRENDSVDSPGNGSIPEKVENEGNEEDNFPGFVAVPSDYLVIDYSQIININFSYFKESENDQPEIYGTGDDKKIG